MSQDTDSYSDWEKRRNSFWVNLQKSITPVAIVGFLALILVGAYLVTKKDINPNYVYLTIVGVVVLLIFKADRSKDKQPIPEHVIKIIGYAQMRRKIGGIEYPTGTLINPTPYCQMVYEGEWGTPFRPFKWEVGFKVIFPNGLKQTHLAKFHPFDGYITGIRKAPAGYTGDESKDLKIIMPMNLQVQDVKPSK